MVFSKKKKKKKSTFHTHLSQSKQRVFPQCAGAGGSSAVHSGQMPSHSLDSHTDKASHLGWNKIRYTLFIPQVGKLRRGWVS